MGNLCKIRTNYKLFCTQIIFQLHTLISIRGQHSLGQEAAMFISVLYIHVVKLCTCNINSYLQLIYFCNFEKSMLPKEAWISILSIGIISEWWILWFSKRGLRTVRCECAKNGITVIWHGAKILKLTLTCVYEHVCTKKASMAFWVIRHSFI